MASVLAVHGNSVYSPAGQPVQSAHCVLRNRVQPDTTYWSMRHSAHVLHMRLVVGVGAATSYAVLLQLDCDWHTRFEVAVGGVDSYWANVHTVRSRHTMSDVSVACVKMY